MIHYQKINFSSVNSRRWIVIFALKLIILEKTLQQYDAILAMCKEVFLKKNKDYGTAWRILRPSSLTDQIFIKAKRIRSLEQNKIQKVSDSIESEFIGIINYCALALAQLQLSEDEAVTPQWAEQLYAEKIALIRALMLAKNHDYGEAWRDMRVSSMTDLILMKVLRIRQIEDNDGKTIISEGLDANYMDIANYAIFALIKLEEARNPG